MTPMLRQYYELKEKAQDAILFFRMGDFFEIFGTDAELVAPILELVLTSRERGDQQRIPFCGVPHHSARNYWLRLLRKGLKVALADQVEDPATAKGLVRREITRIYTPGCIDDLEGLESESPNYILAIHQDPGLQKWAAAVVDLSTGELRLGNIEDLTALTDLVHLFRPKEILARKFFHDDIRQILGPALKDMGLLLEPLPEAPLRDQSTQKSLLKEVLASECLDQQPCGKVPGGQELLAAMFAHFKSLQASLSSLLNVVPLRDAQTMVLDETVIRDLELFETARRRQADGSLFKTINQTLSPMGARLFRHALCYPLLNPEQIAQRHDGVAHLLGHGEPTLAELRELYKGFPDLERLVVRVGAMQATPNELARLRLALQKTQLLEQKINHLSQLSPFPIAIAQLIHNLQKGRQSCSVLTQSLEDQPSALGHGQGVFRLGWNSDLDKLMEMAQSGEVQVSQYQEVLKNQTGISSLKVKNHSSYGLLIEVTKTHAAKIPANFIRRQTMVNCDRFTTVELQELNENLTQAQGRAVVCESELFTDLLAKISTYKNDLRDVANAIAQIDLLISFAWQAVKHHYCRPIITEGLTFVLKGSRHPVVESHIGPHAFFANSLEIEASKAQILLTGPNMAGKSTFMRQMALTAILCQIGSFVPAQSAVIPIFDRVFTRVGATDDLARGQSTFMVEMSETAQILRHATARSLVILDEVGRGTSTQDGLALAAAILTDIANRLRCVTLFATHYHELVDIASELPTVRLMQTEVTEKNDKIIFTHRLIEGATGSSYGLEVARIAGIPEPVLKTAREFTHNQGHQPGHFPYMPAKAAQPARSPTLLPLELNGQLKIKDEGDKNSLNSRILERLTKVNVNRLTPLQALNIISEIQELMHNKQVPWTFSEDTC